MTKADMQKGLWQWFLHSPQDYRSFTAVDTVCQQLYKQYERDTPPKLARYALLYPLLRYGLVEFYGHKQFALSPTIVLEGERYLLLVHVPGANESLPDNLRIYSHLGLSVYEKSDQLSAFLEDAAIKPSQFRLVESLQRFSSFDNIVHQWPLNSVIDMGSCYHFTAKGTWKLTVPVVKGVYRKTKEPYAQKMLLTGDQWRNLPRPEQQIDAFALAKTWSDLQNNSELGILYETRSQKLIISSVFFPLLIERLLFVHTLLQGRNELNPLARQYDVDTKAFLQLQRLFENRITQV